MDWFVNTKYLWFFIGILMSLAAFIWINARQKKAMQKFTHPSLFNELMPLRSKSRKLVKFILSMLAISFMIVAAAKPKIGERREIEQESSKEIRKGIQVMIALDVSKSMEARDEKPDRLTRAKLIVEKLIENMKEDLVGLVIFAGEAYIQVPITEDYKTTSFYLKSIDTDMIKRQGTAIGSAIDLCSRSFRAGEGGKAIIVISDGENHEDDAVQAAKDAVEKGAKVFTIGIGTENGATIPEGADKIMKDNNGNPVIAKMNPEMLIRIAEAGEGKFFKHSSAENINKELLGSMKVLPEEESGQKKVQYMEWEDWFQYFLGIALLFIVLESLILEKRNLKLMNLSIFERR
ncbi:MAG: VWA domain-containing protein [Bacteroidales bacterium]|nr:VWA domain-containing protein [Bacteroidales bacterium]